MKAAKKIGQVFLSIVLWGIILLSALFAFTTLASKNDSNVSMIGGIAPMIVQSDSMKPTFNAGDLIIVKSCKNKDALKVGDIVTFHTIIENQYALNTHRIAEITETNGVRSYTTKGDNNAISDVHFITNGDIVGQYVTKIPALGKVMTFLTQSTAFLLIIVLPMVLFLMYQIYHLVMVSIKLKRAVALENAEQAAGVQSDDAAAAEKARAEAEAALAEAKRIREQAEAELAAAQKAAQTSAAAPAEEAPANAEEAAAETPAEEAPAETEESTKQPTE